MTEQETRKRAPKRLAVGGTTDDNAFSPELGEYYEYTSKQEQVYQQTATSRITAATTTSTGPDIVHATSRVGPSSTDSENIARSLINKRVLLGLAVSSIIIVFFYYALLRGGQAVIDTGELLLEKGREAKEVVVEEASEVKDYAFERGYHAYEKGKELLDKGFHVAKEAEHATVNILKAMGGKAKEYAVAAKEKMGEWKESAREKASNVAEKLGEWKETVKEKVSPVSESVKGPGVQTIGETTESAYEKAGRGFEEALDSIKEGMNEYSSAAAAAAESDEVQGTLRRETMEAEMVGKRDLVQSSEQRRFHMKQMGAV